MNSGEFDQNKLASVVLISKLQIDNDEKDETIKQLKTRIKELENKNNVQDFVTCLHCGNKFERYKEYPLQEMCNKCLKDLTK